MSGQSHVRRRTASTDHVAMPTHRDKTDGFEEAVARRSRELDDAIERSRAGRRDRALAELPRRM